MIDQEKQKRREEILTELDERLGAWPIHIAKWLWWSLTLFWVIIASEVFSRLVDLGYLSCLAFVVVCGGIFKLTNFVSTEMRQVMIRSRMKLAGALESKSYYDFQNKVLEEEGLGFSPEEYKEEAEKIVAEIEKIAKSHEGTPS